MSISPYVWFVLALLMLVLIQKWIHRHLHGLAYLLTGHADAALMVYALPLLPGVALHEIAHAVMASLLGVKSANLTIVPSRQPDGHVRLGSVQVERVDAVRASLIGLAPLLFGSAAVLLISVMQFGVSSLGDAVPPRRTSRSSTGSQARIIEITLCQVNGSSFCAEMRVSICWKVSEKTEALPDSRLDCRASISRRLRCSTSRKPRWNSSLLTAVIIAWVSVSNVFCFSWFSPMAMVPWGAPISIGRSGSAVGTGFPAVIFSEFNPAKQPHDSRTTRRVGTMIF